MNTKIVLYALLAICYPLGEYLQNNMLTTPQFLRFHLSDFGFVPYHSLKAGILWFIVDNLNRDKLAGWLRAGLYAALAFALVAEFTGKTDWIDVACYLAGFWIAFKLLPKKSTSLPPKNGGIPTRFKGSPKVNRKTKRKPRKR